MDLFIELQAWYEQHPPSKKRSRSSAGAVEEVSEFVRTYNNDDADNFVDPLEDPPAAVGREIAAAAAARPGAGGAAAGAAPPAAGGAGAV